MESESGKLFIGGISWDTNDDRLREYFGTFGEVLEAMIMKDRTTGRARGFGFVIFSDPAVAEKVVLQKHVIDGRWVEAKKAVPYEQQFPNKKTPSIQDSPAPFRTKKIFVGGLPATVTEADFKNYFEQFGTIVDVIVMYDHNTKRHRGFGFITYASEDSVDKVLAKTFHDLNGKMVEVKRAVPKEMLPSPIMRSPISLSRNSSFIEGYTQGYSPSLIGSYGMRMDGRIGLDGSGRHPVPSFGPGYGIGMNFEPGMSPSYGELSNFSNSLGYGRVMSPYITETSSRYASPTGYSGSNDSSWSVFSSSAQNLLGNVNLNHTANSSSPNPYMARGSSSIDTFGNGSLNWRGSSPSYMSTDSVGGGSSYANGLLGYGTDEAKFSLRANSFMRDNCNGLVNAFASPSRNGMTENYTDLGADSSLFEDTTWRSASAELDVSSSFAYDDIAKDSAGFMGGYSDTNRQTTRGIAT